MEAERFRAVFPATPHGIGAVRGEVAAIAGQCGLTGAALEDLRLAVTEAATNVVQHAYIATEGNITIAVALARRQLIVTVSDSGNGLRASSPNRGFGMGLPLMADLAEDFELHTGGSGTTVRLTFHCPELSEGASETATLAEEMRERRGVAGRRPTA